MGVYDKLRAVQAELKAPKSQYNKFGGYSYRSCEDILEALKPLLAKHNATVTVSDDLVMIGDRFYIKATASFYDTETKEAPVVATSFARESAEKKGMDSSQITGSASSYARKYALNGLLLIDDNKDSDTNEQHEQGQNGDEDPTKIPSGPITKGQIAQIMAEMKRTGITAKSLCKQLGINDIAEITEARFPSIMDTFGRTPDRAA